MNENHFPSAALNAFKRFIAFRKNSKDEAHIDLDYNADQTYLTLTGDYDRFIIKEDTLSYKTPRTNQMTYNNQTAYPRNLNESILAKQRSNWQCENDINHTTFDSASNNKPYMEAHHLVPMSYQRLFRYTIDFADNIICLFPNCHRIIHFSNDSLKAEIINNFFNQRKSLYPKYGIKVDLKTLIEMYNIKLDT